MSEEKNLLATIDPFTLMWRQAKAFAGSTLIPESMRDPNNCFAAMMMADEMGESRLAVMQSLESVHGRPCWITAFMISRVNRAKKFKHPLDWKTKQKDADNVIVQCYGELPDGREVSIEIDYKTAVESGWTTYKDRKDNYKIKTHDRWATPTMSEQMLRWRTAAWLIRLYCPEVMMGLPTKDEVEDISGSPGTIDMPPIQPPTLKDFTVAKPTESVEPGPKPSEEAAVRSVDEAGRPGEDDAGLTEAANPRQVSPMPQSSVEAEQGKPQNPQDHPPAVHSLAAAPPPSKPPGSASYALPMVMKNGKPDLRAWAQGRLLPKLLAATKPEVVAWIIGDNHEHIEAYQATLQPLEGAAFDSELKRIAEELTG